MSVPNPPPQPPPPPSGVPEEAWSKNRLQQYAQRASLPLPVYQTVFDGSPQAPTFKSRVWVDGTCFASPNSFSTRKMAEQDAARHALIGIREKVKIEGPSSILQDTRFCKSIINEYAVKMNLTPTYVTNQSVVMLPIFVSSLVLNGVAYVGDAGRNKREAEQFAARSAIISILDSESNTTMSEIVKSKFRFYEALQKVKDLCRSSCSVSTRSSVSTDMNSLEYIKHSSEVKSDNIPAGSEIDVNEHTIATPQSGIHLPTTQSELPTSTSVTTQVELPKSTSVTTQVELPDTTLDQHVNTQVQEFEEPKLTTSDMKDSSGVKSEEIPAGLVNTRKEIGVSEDTTATPQSGIQLPCTQIELSKPTPVTTKVELPDPTLDQYVNTQLIGVSVHEFKRPKLTTSSEAVAFPIEFVPPALGESRQGMMCSTSRKKRNRKNKKAKMKK